MLLETPVIAAKSGGNPEAIEDGENGLIVPPDDPESFADAALALIDDPARAKRIAVTAHEQALSRFGVASQRPQIRPIYPQRLAGAACRFGTQSQARPSAGPKTCPPLS